MKVIIFSDGYVEALDAIPRRAAMADVSESTLDADLRLERTGNCC